MKIETIETMEGTLGYDDCDMSEANPSHNLASSDIGIKYDDNKLRYDLVPSLPFRELVKVITFGANKYAPNNWQLVEPARPRYSAALMRHFELWRQGEQFDKETGIHHLAHCACNALFLMWFDLTGK